MNPVSPTTTELMVSLPSQPKSRVFCIPLCHSSILLHQVGSPSGNQGELPAHVYPKDPRAMWHGLREPSYQSTSASQRL